MRPCWIKAATRRFVLERTSRRFDRGSPDSPRRLSRPRAHTRIQRIGRLKERTRSRSSPTTAAARRRKLELDANRPPGV